MTKIKLTILGSGSAKPNERAFNSAQVLEINGKTFMIDCGDGAQIRFASMGFPPNKLTQIFISHLHGDHCFGLIGLISTLALFGRKTPLNIYAHADLEKMLRPQIDYFCRDMPFEVIFHAINPHAHALIYEDRRLTVHTLPLKHSIPTCGFLFREKEKERHLRREKIDFYQIPVRELHRIKQGADFLTADNRLIPNAELTLPPTPPKSYAYCSDTAFCEKLIPLLTDVDCLYHEATFAETETARAKETCHSTGMQAARMAQTVGAKRLLIGHFSARYPTPNVILAEAKTVFENTFCVSDKREFEI